MAVLEAVARARPWLGVRVTDAQLIADVAGGYDAVIVGADKWAQIIDAAWYGGSADGPRRRRGPASPAAARAPGRRGTPVGAAERLEIAADHGPVSSTAVRAGRREWMAPEAAAFDAETGAWSDPERYARWRATGPAPAPPARTVSRTSPPGSLLADASPGAARPSGRHRVRPSGMTPAGEPDLRRGRLSGGGPAPRHLCPGDPEGRLDLQPLHARAADRRHRARRALASPTNWPESHRCNLSHPPVMMVVMTNRSPITGKGRAGVEQAQHSGW